MFIFFVFLFCLFEFIRAVDNPEVAVSVKVDSLLVASAVHVLIDPLLVREIRQKYIGSGLKAKTL